MDEVDYGFVDRVADSLVEVLAVDCRSAISYAERLAKSLRLDVERQPDSTYRFISGWFDP